MRLYEAIRAGHQGGAVIGTPKPGRYSKHIVSTGFAVVDRNDVRFLGMLVLILFILSIHVNLGS